MKLNNKGFAISTLIYGLSIMGIMLIAILMGVMAVNRSNNRVLSSEIEDDLNKFSETEKVISAGEGGQMYSVPKGEGGWYRIELWGADGGASGGKGAYTTGLIELEAEDVLYFYVGKSGTAVNSTDVRLINNATDEGIKSRLMVAAGGGNQPGANGGTLTGYNASMVAQGGKLKNGADQDYSLEYNATTDSGTLVGYLKNFNVSNSYTSNPTPNSAGNGGSGFFSSTSGSNGGISYIAGYAGCRGYNMTELGQPLSDKDPGYVTEVVVDYTEESVPITAPKTYYFVDGMMFSGVNKGDGKAKIERIVKKTKDDQKLVRRNTKLNGVTEIKDCVSGVTLNSSTAKISAISEGKECVSNITYSGSCMTATIGSVPDPNNLLRNVCENLDEIATWHGVAKDYVDHTITVNNDSKTLKGKSNITTLSETETPVGFRISAYQPDSTVQVPKTGNYYIMPVLSENEVLTAHATSGTDTNAIQSEYISGYKRQKWSIQLITNPKLYDSNTNAYDPNNENTFEYRITELARFNALNILNQENLAGNDVGAVNPFNTHARVDDQIWKVKYMGNGTYTISSARPRARAAVPSGNIYPNNKPTQDGAKLLKIGKNNNTTERFKLIATDYSCA